MPNKDKLKNCSKEKGGKTNKDFDVADFEKTLLHSRKSSEASWSFDTKDGSSNNEAAKLQKPSMGRITGAVFNKIVKTGMQTPLTKYLLSPQVIKKALNNDPILKETFRIIMASEPVQNLMKPETLKVILDSETAESVLTPENFIMLMNHPIISEFLTPDVFKFVLESPIVQRLLTPETILEYMETNLIKGFMKPEILHEILYSDIYTKVVTQESLMKLLNTSTVQGTLTTENIQDMFECPGAKATMTQEMVDNLLQNEGVKNLLRNPVVYAQTMRFFKGMEELFKEESKTSDD